MSHGTLPDSRSALRKKVVIDFDNTMGVKGCDVDDGLALLYLLGCPNVELMGACTTFGNNTLETVHENTRRLFSRLGLKAPAYHGGANPNDLDNEASAFLARIAAESPGEISVLATGSLTNLKGAASIDPNFFGNLAEIVVMGGVTESLVINGRIMNELNFSCDARAAYEVLGAHCPVSVATSQNCLPAYFLKEHFAEAFGGDAWISQTIDYWFEWMSSSYEVPGFICWDTVAAAWLATPELFDAEEMKVTLNERLLSVGYLERASKVAPQACINAPRIKDPEAFVAACLKSWKRALA